MKEKILNIIYKIGFWFIKISAAPGLLWFRPKCYYPGGKKIRIEGGALLIANHITMLDPYYMQYLVWYRNHHFVCLKEFYEKKARAFLFHCFQCIPVDRENAGTGTMREIAAHLKKEELVCMFPEGTVNRDGTEKPEIHQFKSGMVLVALMAGKPIVPMVIGKTGNPSVQVRHGAGGADGRKAHRTDGDEEKENHFQPPGSRNRRTGGRLVLLRETADGRGN